MTFSHARTPAQSLREYGRGVAGGLIFSLPLLYTMEVWQASYSLRPGRLALYVVVTFALLLLYNRFAGLRRTASWTECAIDSVEELGLGLVVAAILLWVLGRLEDASSLLEAMGVIVLEGMTVAIGVSVGTAQLGTSNTEDDEEEGDEKQDESSQDNDRDQSKNTSFLSQVAIAFCGAVIFVANVAPTDEILIISSQVQGFKLLLIALLSLVMGGYVLFFSEFRGSSRFAHPDTPLFLVRGIIVTYAVALVASALTLFFFGRLDNETFVVNIAQTVVAGFAGTLGASAGRLLLQCEQ